MKKKHNENTRAIITALGGLIIVAPIIYYLFDLHWCIGGAALTALLIIMIDIYDDI